jgi:IS6 family transposase
VVFDGCAAPSRSALRRWRRRFPVEIILLCVRWYCEYGISCCDLVEMMQERDVEVGPSTICHWVQCYAPEIEMRVRQYQGPCAYM